MVHISFMCTHMEQSRKYICNNIVCYLNRNGYKYVCNVIVILYTVLCTLTRFTAVIFSCLDELDYVGAFARMENMNERMEGPPPLELGGK